MGCEDGYTSMLLINQVHGLIAIWCPRKFCGFSCELSDGSHNQCQIFDVYLQKKCLNPPILMANNIIKILFYNLFEILV